MSAYYNENDQKAAAWLRSLIAAGLIAPGDVDERSITDVRATDLVGYRQCHFFAGIGGWSYALRLAGWPDDRPVWTGSCPCQPFSVAGKGEGENDERHLWPVFRELIAERRPSTIFGEQVASNKGREWYGGTASMQRMRDRQAIERVLQSENIPQRLQDKMQSLLSITRKEEESVCPACGKIGKIQELPEARTSESFIECSEIPGSEEGAFIKYFVERNRKDVFPWALRAHKDTIQSRRWKNMGQSVVGSHRQFKGIRFWKRQDGSLLRECHGEHMGRIKDIGDCRCDSCGEIFAIGLAPSAIGSEIERTVKFKRSLAGVRSDLETLGYAVGGADLCAASVGSPQIRQRLFWVADRINEGSQGRLQGRQDSRRKDIDGHVRCCGADSGVANAGLLGSPEPKKQAMGRKQCRQDSGVGNSSDSGLSRNDGRRSGRVAKDSNQWDKYLVILCKDGKLRRIKPGVAPLANGIPGRVAQLRGLGNAIVPQVAKEFIKAYLETVNE